jgi:uncharacterized protein
MIYLNVPGVTNSGPRHWQSFWEKEFPGKFRRIEQDNWNTPVCSDWTARIESIVRSHGPENVIMTAHSLGCSAVAHWAREYGTAIRGAMLVAPSDCEAPTYTFDTKGFAPIALERLPFPSIVVASTDDVYVSLERAKQFAAAWGSELINIGANGHVNADSGHGRWPEGLDLLKGLE